MTLDELITWFDSQARRCAAEADEMEQTGHPVATTVDMFKGRAEIHAEITRHLKLYQKMCKEADLARLTRLGGGARLSIAKDESAP